MAEDTMFQDAVDALRQGNKARAKELLTLLLKAEQTNATYWVWMSAAVDSTKERIYCLQTAFKLDPENASAKRGLILLGALPPDESVEPFPLNRARAWEQNLLLSHEQPKPKGIKAITSNPAARLASLIAVGVLLIGLVVFGSLLPRGNSPVRGDTNTPGPSPTFTLTPTFVNATAQASPTYSGPTPLWMLLPETYTPTPPYVSTQREAQSSDLYLAAQAAASKGDWDTYINYMRQVAQLEPQAADVQYYIGDAFLAKGDVGSAMTAYNNALSINENFGAAYLGLARARLLQDPSADIIQLLDLGLQKDPNFGEMYIQRADYYVRHNDPNSALTDLDAASRLLPESPLVYLGYANAYLALGDMSKALPAAQKANQLDRTLLPAYLILGQAYAANGQYTEAIQPLETYTLYKPDDANAFAVMGQVYYEMKSYQPAIDALNKAFAINPGLKNYYVFRGLASLQLGDTAGAVNDLEKAFEANPNSFEIDMGLTQAYYAQQKFGSAYLKVMAAKLLAKTDEEMALYYYWHGLTQEKRDAPADAREDYKALLALPESAMTPEMRTTAQQHLSVLVTPTNTPKPTITPSSTPTPKPTRPGSATMTPTKTKTPTSTLTPKPGSVKTATATP